MRWHTDEAVFNKECTNYPGFVTKFRVSNQYCEANDLVGFENYRHVCYKWHCKITRAIIFCLDSKDYMQIRNAFIILMRILPHFPVLVKLGEIIERKVQKVREEEKNKRQDLFVLASSYIGQLKARASLMMVEKDFHQTPNAKPTAAAAKPAAPVVAAIDVDEKKPEPAKVVEVKKSPAPKETKSDKKLNRHPIKPASPQPQVKPFPCSAPSHIFKLFPLR